MSESGYLFSDVHARRTAHTHMRALAQKHTLVLPH